MSTTTAGIKVLNEAATTTTTTKSAAVAKVVHNNEGSAELSKTIQKLIKRVKAEFMMSDCIDYTTLKKSELFGELTSETYKLNNVDLTTYTEMQRKAFFINVYNTLTIHGVLMEDSLPDSVLSVKQFWQSTAYKIGGLVFSLDDIEHGILRANNAHPSSQTKPFEDGDPRLKFTMTKLDPRVHFALNCGAKSCPVVSVYSEENLETGLDLAAKSFCDQETIVLPKNEEVYVSKIFEWYESDFGLNDIAALRWTLPYLPEEKSQQMALILHSLESIGVGHIIYNEYNWSLNSTWR